MNKKSIIAVAEVVGLALIIFGIMSLVSFYLTDGADRSDINRDGVVDLVDLSILLSNLKGDVPDTMIGAPATTTEEEAASSTTGVGVSAVVQ